MKGRKYFTLQKFFLGAISLFTLITAVAQSIIAYKQLEAAKLSYSPVFIFKEKLIFNEGTGMYDDDNLEVVNMGFPINNFTATLNEYLTVSKTTFEPEKKEEILNLPIDYYSGSYSVTGGKDTLATFVGFKNNHKFVHLNWDVNNKNLESKANGPYYNIKMVKAIKIAYTDIEGKRNELFYINQKPTSSKEFNKFEKQSALITAPRELSELNANAISNLFVMNK